MVEPAFNQMQVQTNIDVTFASGVKALLRQDPDIIMVGEIRDLKPPKWRLRLRSPAIWSFPPLHTNDAPSALTRLIELGIPPYHQGNPARHHGSALGAKAVLLLQARGPNEPDTWQSLTSP